MRYEKTIHTHTRVCVCVCIKNQTKRFNGKKKKKQIVGMDTIYIDSTQTYFARTSFLIKNKKKKTKQ